MEIHLHLPLLIGISSFHACSTTGPAELGFLSLALADLFVDVFIHPIHVMFPDLLQLSVQCADVWMTA
jgi:hypothetical protein